MTKNALNTLQTVLKLLLTSSHFRLIWVITQKYTQIISDNIFQNLPTL